MVLLHISGVEAFERLFRHFSVVISDPGKPSWHKGPKNFKVLNVFIKNLSKDSNIKDAEVKLKQYDEQINILEAKIR